MGIGDYTGRIRQLLQKRHWTKEEQRWLLRYLNTTDGTELRQLMREQFDKEAAISSADAKAAQLLILIHQKIEEEKKEAKLSFLRGSKPMMIAACIVLVFSMGVIAYLYPKPQKDKAVAIVTKSLSKDIGPGRTAAVLTLSDGSTIVLDSAKEGTLGWQGNMKVLKLNGRLSYKGSSSNATNEKPLYNTLSTQRGNQYELVLADGSKVWLNAASSIRFPTAFTNKERSVEVSGEAYFEVAPLWVKGQRVPFKVKINRASGEQGQVEVLGTHFNINAYEDEPEVKTTLLEGSVKVMSGNAVQMLAPGQQAVLNEEGLKVQPTNVAAAIGWKRGVFEFHDASLKSMMRQLSRWYDVEVKFSGTVSTKLYNGSIRRQATLSQVLQILKLAGVNYSIEGRTVTIGADENKGG